MQLRKLLRKIFVLMLGAASQFILVACYAPMGKEEPVMYAPPNFADPAVRGEVTDKALAEPVEGAEVAVTYTYQEEPHSLTETADYGSFYVTLEGFENSDTIEADCDVNLTVTKDGYKSDSKTVTFKEGDSVYKVKVLNFELEAETE